MNRMPAHELPTIVLTIGELSQRTGASVRSIRHYDEHGLLASVRASNGYRMFPDKAVAQVKQIQRMIATGFTIEDIRGFPDCMLLIEGARSCDQITDVQRQRLAAIDRQIADLERRRTRLIKTLSEGAVPPVD
ncbi:MerR family transcriptional regulator [Paraburkholderia fungorum]|uniref:MerR family transcriptional regulator n=1 Tax=Paraburkholderia fungorum TaxID=134537 RepID=UPI001182E8FB|nr:MerR family transcriptional regulator [Paraburkholderia fungorum]MBU7441245.1 MerR family transcriptional regulator [Paraburkholderia fungorum]